MSSRRTRASLAALACLLGLSAAATGCARRTSSLDGASADTTPPAAEPAPVEVLAADSLAHAAQAAQASFETALAPLHDVQVVARLDGQVVGVDVEEGQRVGAGDRLAQLDDREQRATLEVREAEVARAESGWRRAQRLHEQKLISEEQFIAAHSEWQIAVAQRDQARIEWERCTVRSPIRGVVERRRVQMGQMVREGDALFRIGDPDTLRAELLLPESRLGTVRVGQRVRIVPSAGGAPILARVTRVNPLVDPASGTFRVVIDLDNRAGRLPAGVSARVILDAPPDARR